MRDMILEFVEETLRLAFKLCRKMKKPRERKPPFKISMGPTTYITEDGEVMVFVSTPNGGVKRIQ